MPLVDRVLVDSTDAIAVGQQSSDQMTANKPPAARDDSERIADRLLTLRGSACVVCAHGGSLCLVVIRHRGLPHKRTSCLMPRRSLAVRTLTHAATAYNPSTTVAIPARTRNDDDSRVANHIRNPLPSTIAAPVPVRRGTGDHGSPSRRDAMTQKQTVSTAARTLHAIAAPIAPNVSVSAAATARYGITSARWTAAITFVRPTAIK